MTSPEHDYAPRRFKRSVDAVPRQSSPLRPLGDSRRYGMISPRRKPLAADAQRSALPFVISLANVPPQLRGYA